MQNIAGGNQHANFLSHRHDQRIVDFQQIVFAFRRIAVNLVLRSGKNAVKLNAVGDASEIALAFQIFISPFPLIAGDLDGHIGRRGVAHRQHTLSCRESHADQNEERDDGPSQLHGGIFVKVCRLVADRFAVVDHRVEHRSEHRDEDDETDHEHDGMQVVHFLRHRRLRLLQIPFGFVLRPYQGRNQHRQRDRADIPKQRLDHASPKRMLFDRVSRCSLSRRANTAHCSLPRYSPNAASLPWERNSILLRFPPRPATKEI